MQSTLPIDGVSGYKSRSQQARIATEAWAACNLYCPNCDSPSLISSPVNAPAVDYYCPTCIAPFQLKSQSRALSRRIVDSAYGTMVRAIQEDRTPNLFVLHYEPTKWEVVNLILIPHFAFFLSAIEKRKPLGPSARRAGWVGCNILLSAIPPDAKITVIREGTVLPPVCVREQYAEARPLANLGVQQRGWTLDVLNVVRSLGRKDFSLNEVYGFEDRLSGLHPGNKHVREKIRQQLQVLRDLSFLQFLGQGRYLLRRMQ